jgi:hypothetical protein
VSIAFHLLITVCAAHTHTCYLVTIYLFVLPGIYTTKVSALVDEVNCGSDDPSGTGSVDHGGGKHLVGLTADLLCFRIRVDCYCQYRAELGQHVYIYLSFELPFIFCAYAYYDCRLLCILIERTY